MNIETVDLNANHLAPKSGKINYTDISRGASLNGLRAEVLLETRVLEQYAELDPALGHNTAGVVLSVLLSNLACGNGVGDDRFIVCLVDRERGQAMEVELMLLRRRHGGNEAFYLRIANVQKGCGNQG